MKRLEGSKFDYRRSTLDVIAVPSGWSSAVATSRWAKSSNSLFCPSP